MPRHRYHRGYRVYLVQRAFAAFRAERGEQCPFALVAVLILGVRGSRCGAATRGTPLLHARQPVDLAVHGQECTGECLTSFHALRGWQSLDNWSQRQRRHFGSVPPAESIVGVHKTPQLRSIG